MADEKKDATPAPEGEVPLMVAGLNLTAPPKPYIANFMADDLTNPPKDQPLPAPPLPTTESRLPLVGEDGQPYGSIPSDAAATAPAPPAPRLNQGQGPTVAAARALSQAAAPATPVHPTGTPAAAPPTKPQPSSPVATVVESGRAPASDVLQWMLSPDFQNRARRPDVPQPKPDGSQPFSPQPVLDELGQVYADRSKAAEQRASQDAEVQKGELERSQLHTELKSTIGDLIGSLKASLGPMNAAQMAGIALASFNNPELGAKQLEGELNRRGKMQEMLVQLQHYEALMEREQIKQDAYNQRAERREDLKRLEPYYVLAAQSGIHLPKDFGDFSNPERDAGLMAQMNQWKEGHEALASFKSDLMAATRLPKGMLPQAVTALDLHHDLLLTNPTTVDEARAMEPALARLREQASQQQEYMHQQDTERNATAKLRAQAYAAHRANLNRIGGINDLKVLQAEAAMEEKNMATSAKNVLMAQNKIKAANSAVALFQLQNPNVPIPDDVTRRVTDAENDLESAESDLQHRQETLDGIRSRTEQLLTLRPGTKIPGSGDAAPDINSFLTSSQQGIYTTTLTQNAALMKLLPPEMQNSPAVQAEPPQFLAELQLQASMYDPDNPKAQQAARQLLTSYQQNLFNAINQQFGGRVPGSAIAAALHQEMQEVAQDTAVLLKQLGPSAQALGVTPNALFTPPMPQAPPKPAAAAGAGAGATNG